MTIASIEQDFREKVSAKVRVSKKGPMRNRVFTPFRFDDGDHLMIVLKHNGTEWVI